MTELLSEQYYKRKASTEERARKAAQNKNSRAILAMHQALKDMDRDVKRLRRKVRSLEADLEKMGFGR